MLLCTYPATPRTYHPVPSSVTKTIEMPSNIKVAVTQLEPGWFDLQKSVDKTVKAIKEGADNGAKLISFPECWIPGTSSTLLSLAPPERSVLTERLPAMDLGLSDPSHPSAPIHPQLSGCRLPRNGTHQNRGKGKLNLRRPRLQ